MKKIFLFIFLSTFILFSANAGELDDVINKVYDQGSKRAEGFIRNFISGPGDTEVSIMGKTTEKPEASIMIVRPVKVLDDDVLFYQTQLSNYFVSGRARQGLNLGLGYRKLAANNSSFFGINSFLDADSEANIRASLGLEIRASSFELLGNYYDGLTSGLTNGAETDRVLGGHDISIVGQVPYLPWASLVYKQYEWTKEQASKDSKGDIIKGEFNLTGSLNFEFGWDDNDLNAHTDEFFRLTFVHPPKNKDSLISNPIGDSAFEKSDMREEMLSKVKRSNQVTVEVESSGIIITNGSS
tara:strand:+ start:1738 stop:2631 length:894 start_codon:yes stop_codon:yes gene_type:complete